MGGISESILQSGILPMSNFATHTLDEEKGFGDALTAGGRTMPCASAEINKNLYPDKTSQP